MTWMQFLALLGIVAWAGGTFWAWRQSRWATTRSQRVLMVLLWPLTLLARLLRLN